MYYICDKKAEVFLDREFSTREEAEEYLAAAIRQGGWCSLIVLSGREAYSRSPLSYTYAFKKLPD